MPDNISDVAAASDPPSPPKTRTRYALNDGFTRLLEESEQVNRAASDERFRAALSARGIGVAFTDAQSAAIARGRALMQSAHAGRNEGRASTQTKSQARQQLELLIGQVQSAALQRDVLDDTDKAQNYFVGADVGGANQGQLETIADGIIEQLGHDDIPGVTPADEAALEAANKTYEDEIAAARAAAAAPRNDQIELEELLSEIKRHKQATQLAADAQYPFNQTDASGARLNKITREQFALPVSRKYRPNRSRD